MSIEYYIEEAISDWTLELITKPEEKPSYWCIETSEMKKSEYWEVFKEWFSSKTKTDLNFSLSFYWYRNGNQVIYADATESSFMLSPQQWYDTIYDGEKLIEEELLQKRMDDYMYKSDNLPKSIMVEWWEDSYDKAMDEIHWVEEIPEVSEDKEDNPFTPLWLDIQRRAMVTSLNRLIKIHNKNNMKKTTLIIFITANIFAILLLTLLITWKESMPVSVYPCRPVDIELRFTSLDGLSGTEYSQKLLSEEEMLNSVIPRMDDNDFNMIYPRIAWFWPRGTCYKLDETKGKIRSNTLFVTQ